MAEAMQMAMVIRTDETIRKKTCTFLNFCQNGEWSRTVLYRSISVRVWVSLKGDMGPPE